MASSSGNALQLLRVLQHLPDQLFRVEVNALVRLLLEYHLLLLEHPIRRVVLLSTLVRLRELPQLLQGLELEDVQRLLKGEFGVGLLSTAGNFSADCLRDGIKEGPEVLRQWVLMPEAEDLAVVALLDGVIEQQNVGKQGHPQLLSSDGLQLAVKLLRAVRGEEEEQVDGSHHGVLLSGCRPASNQHVLVEELDIIDGVLILATAAGGQCEEQVQL
jgi:hypothetical protein